MPRERRLNILYAFYHVILRGNGGQKIFFRNEDYYFFYSLIEKSKEDFDFNIHGFCCMSNHVHLIIEIKEVQLSKIIHKIAFRYAQYLNKIQDRKGHLFQGRYKAYLINTDQYLLTALRYIHLNPVRAKIIAFPDKYMWSSHNVYLKKYALVWLTTEKILSYFKSSLNDISSYEKYILAGIGKEKSDRNKLIINKDDNLPCLIEKCCDFFKIKKEALLDQKQNIELINYKKIIAALVDENSNLSLKDLASYLGKSLPTISLYVKKTKNDSVLKKILSKLKDWLK